MVLFFFFLFLIFCLICRFIDIFGFTCDFNFALENEAENVVNDDDDTFVDNELVNREIINSVNNKNNDIENVNSLNILSVIIVQLTFMTD